jgi:hypothetical protein
MILTSFIYKSLLDLHLADDKSDPITISEFNRLIRLVNQDVYDDYIRTFELNNENSDILAPFEVFDTVIALVVTEGMAVGSLPTDYYRLIGKPRTLDGAITRRVDVVSNYEDASREDDYLTKANTTYPTCVIGGKDVTDYLRIRVRPTTITQIWVDYMKTLTAPFLDYYINDSNMVKVFLPETVVVQNVPLGNTYRDGTIGGVGVTVTSLTKNLPWRDGDLDKIMEKLKLAVSESLGIKTSQA